MIFGGNQNPIQPSTQFFGAQQMQQLQMQSPSQAQPLVSPLLRPPVALTEKLDYEARITAAEDTLKRQLAYRSDTDPALAELYFKYGDAVLEKLESSEVEAGREVRGMLRKNRDLLCPPETNQSDKNSGRDHVAANGNGKKSEPGVSLGVVRAAAKGSFPVPEDGSSEEESQGEKQKPEEKKDPLDLADEHLMAAENPVPIYRDDMQIAWECFEATRILIETQLATLSEETNKVEYDKKTKCLGFVRMRLGDVLAMQGKEQEATDEYNKAIDYLKGRSDCELELAAVCYSVGALGLAKKKRDTAKFQETRVILEQMLSKQLGTAYTPAKEDEVNYEQTRAGPSDSPVVVRLKKALEAVYDRVSPLLESNQDRCAKFTTRRSLRSRCSSRLWWFRSSC